MTIQAVSADGVVHEFPDETDTGVIGKAMRDYAASNLSVSDDLKGGLHDLGTSVSQGLGAVGATSASDWVKAHTFAAPSGPAPSEQLAGAIQHGDWANLPGLVGHSLVRAIPSTAPVLAAGAIGGPLAAGATAGAMAIGPEAYGRAANNGRSEPTTGDVVGAIPGALGEAAGGALIPGGSKVASPIGRAALRAAKEAAGGAIMDTSGQLGASVGTDKGAQFDPYQVAGTALTQGAMGAGRAVPDIGKAAIGGLADNVMSRTAVNAPVSDEQAQSQSRVGQMYQAAQEANPNAPAPQVLNNLKMTVARRVNQLASQLYDAQLMDKDLYATTKRVINDLALRQNNSATVDTGTAAPMLLDDVRRSGIKPELLEPLVNGIVDLDTLAPTSFLKNQTGPFRAIASGIGNVAGTAATLGMGGHMVSRLAAPIGGAMDRMLGTSTPKITLQSMAADRYLKANGLQAGADTLEAIQGAQGAVPASPDAASSAAQRGASLSGLNRIRAQAQAAMAPRPNPGFTQPDLINPATAPNPAPAFIRPDVQAPTRAPAPAFIRPDVSAPTRAPAPAFIRPDVLPPAPPPQVVSDPRQASAAAAGLSRIRAQAQAAMVATQPGPDPQTGLPRSPIPVNTPTRLDVPRTPQAPSASSLPPLRVDTAATVRDALNEANGQLGTAPQPSLTPGSRYLTNARPGATHSDAVAMARAAESAGVVPQGTADLIDRSPAPMDRQLLGAIQGHANGTTPQGAALGPIHSPQRYQAAVDTYHAHVANTVQELQRAGQSEAAFALLDIAVNRHSVADKHAARAALPPEVSKLIPDFVVNQGGK